MAIGIQCAVVRGEVLGKNHFTIRRYTRRGAGAKCGPGVIHAGVQDCDGRSRTGLIQCHRLGLANQWGTLRQVHMQELIFVDCDDLRVAFQFV